MKKCRVGVLMGGIGSEREVSLRTGTGVATALRDRDFDVRTFDVGHNVASLVQELAISRLDVAFLALHGRGGEDGCVQGLCELLQIPYTGSGVLASALAMDKVKAKELFRFHNVPTPPYYVVAREAIESLAEHQADFCYPVIVKPRGEGSTIGVTVANDAEELEVAVRIAHKTDRYALVERFVRAQEVHVALLDDTVLGAIEVVPKSGFYDYAAKYTAGATDYILPPRVAPTRLTGVMQLARRAAMSLGCTGVCRVDLLVTEGGNEYVLEVNTLPGMTPTSLVPKIAGAAGYDYGTLCEEIVKRARLHAELPVESARASGAPARSSDASVVSMAGRARAVRAV